MNAAEKDSSSRSCGSDPSHKSTAPVTDTPSAEMMTTPSSATAPSKVQRILRKLIFLPYLIGIVWSCLHPVVSVLTGEPKCRGWYLDEHSIEIKFAEMPSWDAAAHLKVSLPSTPQGQSTLCAALKDEEKSHRSKSISCHVHGDFFSMATITPLANALDPVEEALVFVVPAPPQVDWTTSTFHYTLLSSLERMADPIDTPWLAKTMILVAPNGNHSLEDAVSSFLDAYLGTPSQPGEDQSSSSSSVPPLPPKLSGALLRTLVALDINDQSDKRVVARKGQQIASDQLGRTEFAILPQGRRGVLPNMDLVFLVGKLFTKTMFLSSTTFPNNVSILVHDYAKESQLVSKLLDEQRLVGPLDANMKRWGKDLADMGLFAYNMAMGPYPAHATALDRGIDSITIKVQFEGIFFRDPAGETIQYVEYLVRALSNLHERLHHSFTLYLLPTPYTFVSHMEYFLPNILILLPLAVRAFGLVLWELDRLDLTVVGVSLLTTFTAMALSSVAFEAAEKKGGTTSIFMANTWLVCLYVAIVVVWSRSILSRRSKHHRGEEADESSSSSSSPKEEALRVRSKRRALQSLQFISCVMAAYILVPIAFAHTSLSYVPSLLWTPLLAFPNYGKQQEVTSNKSVTLLAKRLSSLLLLVTTAPPMFLIPRVFETYTAFVQFAYIPLHIQLLLLVATSLLL